MALGPMDEGDDLPDMAVILTDALDELAGKLPDTVSLLRGLLVTDPKSVRAILELRQKMQERFYTPEPPDPEEVALWDVVRIHGLDGFGLEGGGILGNGVPLTTLEGTTLRVLDHLKKRVSESYAEGFAAGRESYLIEQATKATST